MIRALFPGKHSFRLQHCLRVSGSLNPGLLLHDLRFDSSLNPAPAAVPAGPATTRIKIEKQSYPPQNEGISKIKHEKQPYFSCRSRKRVIFISLRSKSDLTQAPNSFLRGIRLNFMLIQVPEGPGTTTTRKNIASIISVFLRVVMFTVKLGLRIRMP